MTDLPIHEPPASSPRVEPGVTVPDVYVPRRRVDVLELDMGDGLIVYNDDASLVHHLNPSAAIVWQLCDGRSAVAALADDIAAAYGLDPQDTRRQVAGLVAEFEALDLVSDARREGGGGEEVTA